jgi:hypothetical protein
LINTTLLRQLRLGGERDSDSNLKLLTWNDGDGDDELC